MGALPNAPARSVVAVWRLSMLCGGVLTRLVHTGAQRPPNRAPVCVQKFAARSWAAARAATEGERTNEQPPLLTPQLGAPPAHARLRCLDGKCRHLTLALAPYCRQLVRLVTVDMKKMQIRAKHRQFVSEAVLDPVFVPALGDSFIYFFILYLFYSHFYFVYCCIFCTSSSPPAHWVFLKFVLL